MIKIYHNATNALVLGGGGNALYLAHTLNYKNPHLKSQPIVIARFNNAESKKSAQFAIARFVCELCKFVEFSWQSKPSLKSHILDCFDFLQKSRNDGVGRFVIARALPEAIHKIKSFCYFLLSQKVESPYPLDFNLQSEILSIRYWLIYFTHRFKSRALDTSLRNATLSMTDFHHLANTRNIRLCERVL